MTNPQVPVSARVTTAAKAVAASVGALATWLGLIATDLASGGALTWTEGGEIIGGAVVLGSTVYAVWRTPNSPKPLQ